MRVLIAFQLALHSLRLNLVRTSLTVLGVVIGVAAIVIVFSAGDGISHLISGEIESYGTNVVQTESKTPGKNSASSAEVTTLKLADMEAINKLDNVVSSYAASLCQQKMSYGSESKKSFVFGVSAPYAQIDTKTKLASGSFFTEEDDRSQAMVVVLGATLKENLFGEQEAVGNFIKVGTKKFQVIGVLAEQGGNTTFLNFDEMAYIPIKTLHKRILGIDYAMYFMHQLRDVSRAEETAEEIRALLRERHEISNPEKDDFRVSTMAEMLDTLGIVTDAVTYLLLAIVLISLLVGGVGIMNIMYVTVTERTPEIGLRKAMGATAQDVAWQFLIESLLITFWGWLLGTVFGILASYGLSLLAQAFNLNWHFLFPWQGIAFSLLFSLICGLLFGYRPAKQAAKLDPVSALRVE
ncbi:MAG TPA: ABC transporter permease [bacterium]|nr:ABC transporter permease [bacterium]HQQ38182.1 ABC transporter permease [bacterium]